MDAQFIQLNKTGRWLVRRDNNIYLNISGNWIEVYGYNPNIYFESLDHIYEVLCKEFRLKGAL